MPKYYDQDCRKKSTHLVSPERKGNIPSKNVVFFNEDQSKEKLPSKEKLNLVTDSRQQWKITKHIQM